MKPAASATITLVAAVIVMTVGGLFVLRDTPPEPDEPATPIQLPVAVWSGRDMQIQRFRYYDVGDEGPRVALRAQAVTIEKQRVGVFSVGGPRVALFRDAEIDFYAREMQKSFNGEQEEMDSPPPGTMADDPLGGLPPVDPSLFFARHDYLIPRGVVVRSLVMSPVRLRFHERGESTMVIGAPEATVRIPGDSMEFTGPVTIIRGSETVVARRLILRHQEGLLRIVRMDGP